MERIEKLWSLKKDALKRIEKIDKSLQTKALIRCNKVVSVGAYTVGADDKGYPKLETTDSPVTFSDKGVEEIKKMTFTHGDGTSAEIKVMNINDWLKERRNELQWFVDTIDKALNEK